MAAKPRTDFPPIRACLFDMDGLLLNTEDLYTISTNTVLSRYSKPPLPWSIKAQLQGRPGPQASEIFHSWAQLPISQSEYRTEVSKLQEELFPSAEPLPGVDVLLESLVRSKTHIALATSSHEVNFKLKTSNPAIQELFTVFDAKRRVLGDDPRIPAGRGKPAPDIYLLALKMINETLEEGEPPIKPEECLVFEDSVPGVEAGRRAGMRAIWCPHPELKILFEGKEDHVLAGQADEGGKNEVFGEAGATEFKGQLGDGWAEYLVTLEDFPYEKYGIVVPNTKEKKL